MLHAVIGRLANKTVRKPRNRGNAWVGIRGKNHPLLGFFASIRGLYDIFIDG